MKRDITFVDTETTGLDPKIHELVEITAIRCNPITLKEISRKTFKILPSNIENASPRALEVNGYDPEVWALEGVPLKDALLGISPLLRGCILGGHNVGFDIGFLETSFKKAGLNPVWHYHKIDTASLAFPLYKRGIINSLSLKNVIKHFGIVNKTPHRAEGDTVASLEVYKAIDSYFPEMRLPYVAFSGIDGSGKTSVSNALYSLLKKKNVKVFKTKEPSSSSFGETLKKNLISRKSPEEEYLLFQLDRAVNWRREVEPALKSGHMVLSDRSGLCTMAYQIHVKPQENILEEWESIAELPDVFIHLKVSPETSLARIENPDSFEVLENLQKSDLNYQNALEKVGKPFHVFDSEKETPEEIASKIIKILERDYSI